jgi:hypothetical protein
LGGTVRSLSFEIEPTAILLGPRTVEKSSVFSADVFGTAGREELASAVAVLGPLKTTAHTHNQDDIVEHMQKMQSTIVAPLRKGPLVSRSGLELLRKAAKTEVKPRPVQDRPRDQALQENGANRTTYKNYLISTNRLSDGSWVASFERIDGAPVVVTGVAQFVLTTTAYLTKLLATADAEIEIDAIAARA